MERARCEAAAAPRNDSAGGAAGWTALRAPESREKCEMLYAYACHVCGPVNLTGETRTGTCNKSHTPSEPRSFFLRKIIRNIARASEIVCIPAQPCACNVVPCISLPLLRPDPPHRLDHANIRPPTQLLQPLRGWGRRSARGVQSTPVLRSCKRAVCRTLVLVASRSVCVL